MNYWFCVTNERNWEIVKKHNTWGVSERNKSRIDLVEIGDILVFYVKRKKIAGIFKTTSKSSKVQKKIFDTAGFPEEETFPYRIKLEPLVLIENPIPFEKLIPKLRFIIKKSQWPTYLRRAMRTISEDDYETIVSFIYA